MSIYLRCNEHQLTAVVDLNHSNANYNQYVILFLIVLFSR